MFFNFHYYVLDNISETIIGQFYAKSERMAKKMMEGFDFKKANLDPKDVTLVMQNSPISCYETYDEIMKSDLFSEVDFVQMDFDFDGEEHDA